MKVFYRIRGDMKPVTQEDFHELTGPEGIDQAREGDMIQLPNGQQRRLAARLWRTEGLTFELV